MTEGDGEPVDVYFHDESQGGDGLSHGHIGTMHIKLSDIAAIKHSLIAGLLADLATHSLPVAVGTSTAAALAERFRKLNLTELFVLDALLELSSGGSIYRVWVDEAALVDWLGREDSSIPFSEESARRELANMKSRDLLEEGAGKWRAVW